ncbi:MAG: hypothetical protein KQ78_01833 [Candidatus Izimaplasma bacterium HR2]|nr:MAG: hypothetical protein KQ78_01833 [Candidatus Izimaplasma bacterium HR2]
MLNNDLRLRESEEALFYKICKNSIKSFRILEILEECDFIESHLGIEYDGEKGKREIAEKLYEIQIENEDI